MPDVRKLDIYPLAKIALAAGGPVELYVDNPIAYNATNGSGFVPSIS